MALPNGYFYIPGFGNRYAMKLNQSTGELDPVVYSLIYPGHGGTPWPVGDTSNFSQRVSLSTQCGYGKISCLLDSLAASVYMSGEYKKARDAAKKASNTTEGQDTSTATAGWIIGSKGKDGKLSFSAAPKVHTTEASAYTECERLARASAGKMFIVFKTVRQVVAGGVQVTDL